MQLQGTVEERWDSSTAVKARCFVGGISALNSWVERERSEEGRCCVWAEGEARSMYQGSDRHNV